MEKLQFNIPLVNLSRMDDVHKEELIMLEKMIQLLDQKDLPTLNILFKDYVDHTQEHFSKEEMLMVEYKFPATICHKSAHLTALKSLLEMHEYFTATQDLNTLKNYIFSEHIPWLQSHIPTMDTVTAFYLKKFLDK